MKKNLLLIAAAATTVLAGCSSEDFAGEEFIDPTPDKEVPIDFGSYFKAMTRADVTGAEAAKLLGNKFVVSGKKGSTTAATTSPIVFDNYAVEYKENTAHTTESNTTNWEYVGKDRTDHAIAHGITRQTIKYWDYSQDQYDFIAWSTGSKTAIYVDPSPAAIPAGSVLVSAINPNATATKAYTFTGSAADLSQCYIADLVTVKKAQYGDNPVTFRFRQLGTKVRIGIYETIPGYSVKEVKFYQTADLLTDPSTEITETPALFTTTANKIFTSGTYKVTFPTVDKQSADPNAANYDSDNNQAHVEFDPGSATQSTVVKWGGLNYTIAEDGEKIGTKFLGRTSNTASFAGNADDNYYVIFLPNEEGTNLNLRVDFTLESIDGGGEEIHVKNAKAQVPSIYTTWKPGYAYTYLFKISDKTNGRTGVYDPTQTDDATVNSDPAGLYPITFDAMVENAEDNDATQETITTVMTPSITTYQQQSTVVNADEYTVNGKDIFVTVNEGDVIVPLYKAKGTVPETYDTKAALYTIPAGKTEAEVVDALQMRDDDVATSTIKGRSGLVLTEATHSLTNTVEFGANGNAIEISATNGEQKALRFTPTATTTYAFVYEKTASTSSEVKYQALNWENFATGQTKYRYDYKAAEGTYCQKGVKYFSKNASDVYTMITAFVGQSVNNLYVKDGANYVIASGLAVPGTQYYYTTDHGMTYKECYAVSYNTAKAAGKLYTFDGTSYTAKAAGVPVDGTAYYYLDGTEYKYAVIHPQKTDNLYQLDETKYVKATEAAKVVGQTYFDKYTINNGEYYTKIIKVQ